MRGLPGGGVLIRAANGWFRFDPAQVRVVQAGDAAAGYVNGEVRYLPDGGVLIPAENGWFRFDPTQERVVPAGDTATGLVYGMRDLPGGGMLIPAEKGWFRFDPAQERVVPFGDAATGSVRTAGGLPGGDVLIGAEKGLFRFDPAQERVVPFGDTATGSVTWMLDYLPGGDVLIRAENGWFRYDAVRGRVVTVNDAATGSVHAARGLPGGGVLLAAEMGWFRFDPEQARIVPAGDPAQAPMPSRGVSIRGPMDVTRDLPDGGVLIGATNGLFTMPALPLSVAQVKPETNLSGLPLRREVAIRMSFQHPCARASDHLGLTLAASLDGAVYAEVPVEFPFDARPAKTKAILSAQIEFPAPGIGPCNCAKERRQSATQFPSRLPAHQSHQSGSSLPLPGRSSSEWLAPSTSPSSSCSCWRRDAARALSPS